MSQEQSQTQPILEAQYFLRDTAVKIVGGPWRGCLAIIHHEHIRNRIHSGTYFVVIDRLGTVCIANNDMIELTEEMLEAPDFDFVDPQTLLAENNLKYKYAAFLHASDVYIEAERQLELCRKGGYFDKRLANTI